MQYSLPVAFVFAYCIVIVDNNKKRLYMCVYQKHFLIAARGIQIKSFKSKLVFSIHHHGGTHYLQLLQNKNTNKRCIVSFTGNFTVPMCQRFSSIANEDSHELPDDHGTHFCWRNVNQPYFTRKCNSLLSCCVGIVACIMLSNLHSLHPHYAPFVCPVCCYLVLNFPKTFITVPNVFLLLPVIFSCTYISQRVSQSTISMHILSLLSAILLYNTSSILPPCHSIMLSQSV